MASIRQKQTEEVIRRHFGSVLQTEGSYIYGNAFVTVTKVSVTPDISMCKIFLSVYNTDDKQKVLDSINENMYILKKNLAHRIRKHVRRIPNITFYIDELVDEMYRVDKLLTDLRASNQMDEEE